MSIHNDPLMIDLFSFLYETNCDELSFILFHQNRPLFLSIYPLILIYIIFWIFLFCSVKTACHNIEILNNFYTGFSLYENHRCGRLIRCDIPRPRTGERPFFAFVEFESSKDAEYAYDKMEGYEIDRGYRLRVDVSCIFILFYFSSLFYLFIYFCSLRYG